MFICKWLGNLFFKLYFPTEISSFVQPVYMCLPYCHCSPHSFLLQELLVSASQPLSTSSERTRSAREKFLSTV